MKSFFEDHDLRFSERLYRSEDYHFWTKVHNVIGSVYLLSKTPLYYYYENYSSVTHTHVNGYWNDVRFIYSDLQKNLDCDAIITDKLDTMLVKRALIAINNATFCKSAKEAYIEITQVLKDEELNRVIKKLDLGGSDKFTRFRFLMGKKLKGFIVAKYMVRWLKHH